MSIMIVLKIVFVALLCVPLLYLGYVLFEKLFDQYVKNAK